MKNSINYLIHEYTKIFLWNLDSYDMSDLLSGFIEVINKRIGMDKMLILYVRKIEYRPISVDSDIKIREISELEYQTFLNYYLLYEFTDNIVVVSKTFQYASMLNYLHTGVLTENDFFTALLS